MVPPGDASAMVLVSDFAIILTQGQAGGSLAFHLLLDLISG